jgi:hypothetical protein
MHEASEEGCHGAVTILDPSFGQDPSVGQSRVVTVPFWKVHSAFGRWSATDFNPDTAKGKHA